jgi:hypothetical protein
MKELTIRIQKHNDKIPCPDCNNIILNECNIGAVYGTLEMGTEEFDKRFKIAYVRSKDNHDVLQTVAMLWNVTEVIYLPVEVKA